MGLAVATSDWLFQSKNLTLGAGEKMAGVDAKRTGIEADAEATSQRVGSPEPENSDDFAITLAIWRFLFR
jgi:hypothetical protein